MASHYRRRRTGDWGRKPGTARRCRRSFWVKSDSRRGLTPDKHCKASQAFNQIKNPTFHFQIQPLFIYIYCGLKHSPHVVFRFPDFFIVQILSALPSLLFVARSLVIDLHAKFSVRSKFNITKNSNLWRNFIRYLAFESCGFIEKII